MEIHHEIDDILQLLNFVTDSLYPFDLAAISLTGRELNSVRPLFQRKEGGEERTIQ